MIAPKTVSLSSAPGFFFFFSVALSLAAHVQNSPPIPPLAQEAVNICPLVKHSSLISLPQTHPLQSPCTENAVGRGGTRAPAFKQLGVKGREGRGAYLTGP